MSLVAATDNWMSADFDDTQWPAAVVAGSRTLPQGISTNASWIWTVNYGNNNTSADSTLYCRLKLSGQYTNIGPLDNIVS